MDLQPIHDGGAGLTKRVGDRERSDVCDELAAHFAAGRLTGEELDDRLARAMRAQTVVDLIELVSDLPRRAPTAPAPHPGTAPGPNPDRTLAWNGFDVICLLLLIGGLMVSGLLLLVAGAWQPAAFVAALVGGTAAAVGGAAAMHLGHRAMARHDQRIASRR
ncbi:DUF1707 domain-containing protein [Microlunatus sp. GCM10028923]|uniref:DUF1707 SHOCT-like domain-containing protein n=1 Tax=Microlunatus sp. GCM10028923 TaxID=3273400 RepID=UPI00360C755A